LKYLAFQIYLLCWLLAAERLAISKLRQVDIAELKLLGNRWIEVSWHICFVDYSLLKDWGRGVSSFERLTLPIWNVTWYIEQACYWIELHGNCCFEEIWSAAYNFAEISYSTDSDLIVLIFSLLPSFQILLFLMSKSRC